MSLEAVDATSEGSVTPPFDQVKGDFYRDARSLITSVRGVLRQFEAEHPPYGLVDRRGNTLSEIGSPRPWIELEDALAATSEAAFNQTTPAVERCPYHESLGNLGSMSLKPLNEGRPDVDRLREVVSPGAKFAPATVVNLVRRVPDVARVHGASTDVETLARNSKHSLLHEPLHHPQQWAKAFTFCLASGYNGTDRLGFRRETFLTDDLIRAYTKIGRNRSGEERIEWAIPTDDFTLRSSVRVPDRVAGPETAPSGEHIATYPAGTRLGDIKVHEPVIGCPGNRMAYEMWDQAIDVAVGEDLWK